MSQVEEAMDWPNERDPHLLRALEKLHDHWEKRAHSMIGYELSWPVLLDVNTETPLEELHSKLASYGTGGLSDKYYFWLLRLLWMVFMAMAVRTCAELCPLQ